LFPVVHQACSGFSSNVMVMIDVLGEVTVFLIRKARGMNIH